MIVELFSSIIKRPISSILMYDITTEKCPLYLYDSQLSYILKILDKIIAASKLIACSYTKYTCI